MGHSSTSAASTTSVVVTCVLSAPQNVKAVMDENDWAVNVSWGEVVYAQSYNVYRSRSSNGTYQLVAENITSTQWADKNPLSGYNYYKVATVCYGYTGSQSSYASVNAILDAPTNVTAEMDETEWAVNVSWDEVKYAQGYNVYWSRSSNGTYQLVAENITTTNWTDERPIYNYNYFKVAAVCNGYKSSQSSYASVNAELDAPTNVNAVMDDDAWAVNVSWDKVKYAQSYNVYRSNQLVAENITSTNWTDKNPLEGDNYYNVAAVCNGYTSCWSSKVSVNVKLDAPTNVKAVMDDNEWIVTVSWDAVKYAECYSIYRSYSSSSGFTKVADSLKTVNWRDEDPLTGRNYYRVYAIGHNMTSCTTSNFVVRYFCPDNKHPHMIDLGLPSGTKWACCNVGATIPDAYGGYYAWGETEEKEYYDWDTYIHCDGINDCHDLGSDISGTQYDVAHVKWGGSWVMPSYDQIKELRNSDNSTSIWIRVNNV